MSFEGVIKDAELRFIKKNGYPPKYLLLNMYGYMKLKQETAVRQRDNELSEVMPRPTLLKRLAKVEG